VRVSVPVLLLVCAAGRLSASDTSLTVTAFSGILSGTARELVYAKGTLTQQVYTKSELDWGLQGAVLAGSTLELETGAGLTASLSVAAAIPGKTGAITDSDWLDYDLYGYTYVTNLTVHDCYTERALFVDVRVGWELRLFDWLALQPFGTVSLMSFLWTARDGHLQFPPGFITNTATLPYPPASADPLVPLAGTIIVYRQDWLIPGVGLSAAFGQKEKLELRLTFVLSPYLFCSDLDNHEFANNPSAGYYTTDFYDALRGGLLLEPGASLRLRTGERTTLSLDASLRFISGLVGDTRVVHGGIGFTGETAASSTATAGVSYEALSVSASFAVRL
jgi:outer membrane protease